MADIINEMHQKLDKLLERAERQQAIRDAILSPLTFSLYIINSLVYVLQKSLKATSSFVSYVARCGKRSSAQEKIGGD